jgi:signal transduction histidine kinase
MIIDKVAKGCETLKAVGGEAAFDKFQGSNSEFIFAGTYIWIHDMEGIMRMHPIKYKLNGKQLLTFKDKKGKLFFAEMNRVAKANGAGWVDYMWPKPGEKAPSLKVSYVQACKVGADTFVLGSGVYGITKEEIEAASK